MLKVGIGSRARKQKGAIEEVINEVRTFGDTTLPTEAKEAKEAKEATAVKEVTAVKEATALPRVRTAKVTGSEAGAGSASVSEIPALVVSELPSAAKPAIKLSRSVAPGALRAISSDAWKGAKTDEQFTALLRGPNPVEIRKTYDPETKSLAEIAYTSVDSPAFQDFIVQTYRRYSPYLQTLIEEATAAAKADGTINDPSGVEIHVERIKAQRKAVPKEMDRDACKRRNPEKRDLFYYQKFIRDYLSRGTPYRGLLVYHGLGSGKTCASIAAAEALYYGGLKKIYILTPATLSNNYRKDIAKCGFYPLRTNNYWQFLKLKAGDAMKTDLGYTWLTVVLGLPAELVEKQGGGWVATPDKPSNWNTLSADERAAIKVQQAAHMEFRFKFIHYNGATPATLSALAEKGVESGETIFDNAIVVIDEVHNLVRTINGTQIGGQPISKIMANPAIEPREATWSTPLARKTKGYQYPRAYTLYRLLQNAVGAKIIVLSATPMINYAQEMAILLNIIGGEQRVAEIPIGAKGTDTVALKEWVKNRPDVDYFKVEEGSAGTTVLTVTPVPFSFSKVVRADGTIRGFVRTPDSEDADVRTSRERNMDSWAASLIADIKAAGLIVSDEPARIITYPLLPDDANEFVDHFIDKNTLKILHENTLKARASGLISYYRGGSQELMPREGINKVVEVPMSDFMFKEYSRARLAEIDNEDSPAIPEADEGKPFDLYAFTTKNKQTGFLSQSRAACNWVFPEEVPRPAMNAKEQAKLLGVEKEKIVAVDMVAEVEAEQEFEQEAVAEVVAVADEVVKPEPTALDARLSSILGTLMSGLEAKGDEYLNRGLGQFSPKYAEMIRLIRESPGPALVYSQFKRLEGLGIFAAALRASDEKYLPLDIQKVGGAWEIPVELMVAGRPRYIMYTGDQDREKRRLLLQLYNADLDELPPKLAKQCRELLAGSAGSEPAVDNRDGRVCRVFMITQSGAEGISLSNTRQVHIMEPYWNNVRIQQVIGRAIRLCSHMNLPWEDRVVDIFTYLSVFSPTQKAEGSKQIMTADKSQSTDQMIYEIAKKKQVLADGLSKIIQSAAVDCQLHYHEHGEATQCYTFSEGARPLFMYHPDWRKDSDEAVRSAAAKPEAEAP